MMGLFCLSWTWSVFADGSSGNDVMWACGAWSRRSLSCLVVFVLGLALPLVGVWLASLWVLVVRHSLLVCLCAAVESERGYFVLSLSVSIRMALLKHLTAPRRVLAVCLVWFVAVFRLRSTGFVRMGSGLVGQTLRKSKRAFLI